MKRAQKKLTLGNIYANCMQKGTCKIWKGGLSRNGYPYLHDPQKYRKKTEVGSGGTARSGRRVVWELKHGETPRRTVIMTCLNKLCLNHEHMKDASRGEALKQGDGLHSVARVVSRTVNRLKQAKLDWHKAEAIRAVLAPYRGKRNDARFRVMQQLAQQYGVGVTAINDVRTGKRWAKAPSVAISSAWAFAANTERQAA